MSSEDQLTEFISITGSEESVARQYIAKNNNDIQLALNDFYSNEKVSPGTKVEHSKPSASNTNRPTQTIRSFSDLKDFDSNNNRSDDDDMNFFTGGEKSGLAVENPNKYKQGRKLVDDLIEQAEKDNDKPDWRDDDKSKEEDNKKVKTFKGTGYSLGSIENLVESHTVKDPSAGSASDGQEKVERTITFWKEGFSVDDGELYKYDDPQNQEYLKQLNQGRAPLSLLNVQMFQPVDVKVDKKLEESFYDHQKAKPRVFGFQGTGQRLGSPVPGEPTTVEEAMELYGENTTNHTIEATSDSTPQKPQEPEEGDTKIQIRLGDGTKLIQKINSTDKVEKIYDIILSRTNDTREWSVVTLFPTDVLDNKKDKTIAEAGLKNTTVVQKWK